MRDQLVAAAILLGYVLTIVGFAMVLGYWSIVWAGLLLIVGALVLDARG